MKNLRTLRSSAAILPADEQGGECSVKACVDSLNETFYIIRGGKVTALDRNCQIIKVADFTDRLNASDVVLCDFLPDEEQLCVVLASGEIILLDVTNETCTEVGMVPSGVRGAAWSPDQQLLVLASEDELVAVSRDFDITHQAPLRPDQSGKDELLTVGWGSRETQFQGAAGRKNREKVDVNKVPVPLSPQDDRRVLVSWRADGQVFTVSTVDELPQTQSTASSAANGSSAERAENVDETVSAAKVLEVRRLRVWDRNVELVSKCEFLAGIEDVLCVKPVGNIIATTQLLNGRRAVRFFERNGQFRGNFSLHAEGAAAAANIVKFLGWNNDATVLAIYVISEQTPNATNAASVDTNMHTVQFWTVSNYDWTQKLQYAFTEPLEAIFWDPENRFRIHTLTRGGKIYRNFDLYQTYLFQNGISTSVNGDELRLTNLKLASIPPPMAHNVLRLEAGVPSDFATFDNRLAFVGDDFRTISIYDVKDVLQPRLEKRFQIAQREENFVLVNLQWKSHDILSAIARTLKKTGNSVENVSILLEIDFNGNIDEIFETSVAISWHKFNADRGDYDALLGTGEHVAVRRESTGTKLIEKFDASAPHCQYLESVKCLMVLTKNYELRLGQDVLHSGVSSFSVAGEFILVTTFSNLLHTIGFKELMECLKRANAAIPSRTNANFLPELFQNGRQIERGAVLVGHEAFGTRVWLQMPRGNLETIHPRPLIIHRLKRTIDALRLGDALDDMRRQRIDTNLLYDHNPELFMRNVAIFVDQVRNVEHLNLFITTLHNEDTRLAMFAPYYPQPLQQPNSQSDESAVKSVAVVNSSAKPSEKKSTSIADICARIRENLLKRLNGGAKKPSNLSVEELNLAILSCYFVEKKVSEALTHIKSQMSRSDEDSADLFRKLVTYLSVLVNEQDLFRHSLKTYDMDLAVEVLNFSNRDPKEVLPILNEFKSRQPAAYRKYHIDVYLEDFRSALAHIAELALEDEAKFAECLKLVEGQRLYAQALFIFYGTRRSPEICKLCGEFALKQRSYNEAGRLFYMANAISSALDAFVLAQSVQNCQFLLEMKQIDHDTFGKAHAKIRSQLVSQRKSTATLAAFSSIWRQESLFPADEIMNSFFDAFQWEMAFNFGTVYAATLKTDGVDFCATVRARLSERVDVLKRQMGEWSRDLTRHLARLEIVRAAKLQQLREWVEQEALGDGVAHFDATQSETLSEASTASSASAISHVSQLSKVSTATSRKKKQIDRKKKKIKEGSHYEDSALLTALKDIYRSIDELQGELASLFYALLATGALDEGRTLQANIGQLFDLASALRPKIWPQFLEAQHLPGPLVEIYRCADGIVRLPADGLMPARFQIEEEMVAPPLQKRSAEWKLLMFDAEK